MYEISFQFRSKLRLESGMIEVFKYFSQHNRNFFAETVLSSLLLKSSLPVFLKCFLIFARFEMHLFLIKTQMCKANSGS